MTNDLLDTDLDWEQLFNGLNTESMWSVFHSRPFNLIDLYVPVQITSYKPKHKWFNSSVSKAIKQIR